MMLFEPVIAPWNSQNTAVFRRAALRIPRARNREFEIIDQGMWSGSTAKDRA
jgi:hypothetical protein